MTFRQFWYSFTENDWPAKVICFAAACLAFFLFRISSVTTRTFVCRLDVEADGMMCLAEDIDPMVKVTLRLPAQSASLVKEEDVGVRVNVTHYTQEGEYDVPVIPVLSPDLLKIEPVQVSVQPEHLRLKLEKLAVRWVPVSPSFSGEPARGYERRSFSVEPDSVQVSGPQSMVAQLDHVSTGRVDVAGARGSFIRKVPILNRNSQLKIDGDGEVSVSATIAAVTETRMFTRQKIEFRNLSPDFIISSVVPQADLQLRGPLLSLEAIREGQTLLTADCSSIKAVGTHELPVRVAAPAGLSVVSRSLERVTVTVSESMAYKRKQLEDLGAQPEKEQ